MNSPGNTSTFPLGLRGLVLLREPTVDSSINVVAIHGLSAHSLKTWIHKSNIGNKVQSWNWLEGQLTTIIPSARVWTFGYESNWYGERSIDTSLRAIADGLLDALEDKLPDQRLMFIAHSFGGILLMKVIIVPHPVLPKLIIQAFLKVENPADNLNKRWTSLFKRTDAILFFGTPFSGIHPWFTDEFPKLARATNKEVYSVLPKILKQNGETLRELRSQFTNMTSYYNELWIGYFYETKASNVGKILDRLGVDKASYSIGHESNSHEVMLVPQDSAVLNSGRRATNRALPRDHFNMNEFAQNDDAFKTIEIWLKTSLPEPWLKNTLPQPWLKKILALITHSAVSPGKIDYHSHQSTPLSLGSTPPSSRSPSNHQPDISSWREPTLPALSLGRDGKDIYVDKKKLQIKWWAGGFSFDKTGISPNCDLVYLLGDNKAQVQKCMVNESPEPPLISMSKSKLPWLCAAISDKFFLLTTERTCRLLKFGTSEEIAVKVSSHDRMPQVSNDIPIPVDDGWGIKCVAIYEPDHRDINQKLVVALGLQSSIGTKWSGAVQLYFISLRDWHTTKLSQIDTDTQAPKILNFLPDGTKLACTVRADDERVIILDILWGDGIPEVRHVCDLPVAFTIGQGEITSTALWRSPLHYNPYIICTTFPDASRHSNRGQWSFIAPASIQLRHLTELRHDLVQVQRVKHCQLYAAAISPIGNLLALVDSAGRLCLVPLRAGGLFSANSGTAKDYGISSDTDVDAIEVTTFKLAEVTDFRMVALRFNPAGDKVFAVDHQGHVMIVHLFSHPEQVIKVKPSLPHRLMSSWVKPFGKDELG